MKVTKPTLSQVDAALSQIRRRRSIADLEDWIPVLDSMALFAVWKPRLRELTRAFMDRVSRMILDITVAKPERLDAQDSRQHLAALSD